MTQRIGIYPGSFDPLTLGHMDIIEGALALVDVLVVAIGVNGSKTPSHTTQARLDAITKAVAPLAAKANVQLKVMAFEGLLVEAAKAQNATLLIRGLRDGTDLDYEMQLCGMNATLAPWLQTVFLPGRVEHRHISGTLVRQIAALGGDISPFVP